MKRIKKPGLLMGLMVLLCLQNAAQQHPRTANIAITEQEDQIQELIEQFDEQSITKDYPGQEQTLITLISLGFDEYWAYNDLGFSQICQQKYDEAIKNIGIGLDKYASNLYLLGNKANCLLLTNQYDQAIAIYKTYKREKPDGKRRFKYVVADDLKEFKRLGIHHPDFKRVRIELGIWPFQFTVKKRYHNPFQIPNLSI